MAPQRHRKRSSLLSSGSDSRAHRPDYVLSIVCLILLIVGLVVVYAISPGLAALSDLSEAHFVQRQMIAIVLAGVTFFIVAKLPLDIWQRAIKPLLVLTLLALLATQFIGDGGANASRWVQIGGLSFQSVELLKFTLVIWLAGFLSQRYREGEINSLHKTIKPIGVLLAVTGFIVAVMQSDLGSMGVVAGIIVVMLFTAGISWKWLGAGLGVILLMGSLLIVGSPYRQDRVTTFLNPQADCLDEGYQACQALIAVGSGGLFGKGIDRSAQAYGYLPEAANDSIFAVLAEMFGFVGVTIVMGLFVTLFTRLHRIVERTTSMYHRLIVVGVLTWLSTQAFINIMAMIGLFPLKGITLPFISFGGTSIIFVTAAVALAFQISRYTTFTPIERPVSSNNRSDRASKVATKKGSRRDNIAQRGRHRRSHNTNPIRRP